MTGCAFTETGWAYTNYLFEIPLSERTSKLIRSALNGKV